MSLEFIILGIIVLLIIILNFVIWILYDKRIKNQGDDITQLQVELPLISTELQQIKSQSENLEKLFKQVSEKLEELLKMKEEPENLNVIQ